VIGKRLDRVRRVVAVGGGKGGIGKSFVASTLALGLMAEGGRAGLLDLDLTGPCAHLFLGVEPGFPDEEFGIIPPAVAGVRFMSLACFAGETPAPMRGAAVSDAMIELLAITRWDDLDCLVVDLPPGIGDPLLDTIRLLRRCEFLAVATQSRVVLDTVRRSLGVLDAVDATVIGILENLGGSGDTRVEEFAAEVGRPFLGTVPADPGVENAVGDPARLAKTDAARAVRRVARRLLAP
jgi:ATP-binding protein involved in chromosome partitioning